MAENTFTKLSPEAKRSPLAKMCLVSKDYFTNFALELQDQSTGWATNK